MNISLKKSGDVMKTVLLLVDLQNDYFPGGKMELEGCTDAGLKAELLLAHFRMKQFPLVHIQHISIRPGATFFLPDTEGVKIHEVVKPMEHEAVFQKHYPNSFRETPLLSHLQAEQVKRIVVCGMMTHMCIDATIRAAFDHGFECLIAHDACATRTLVYQGENIPARNVHLSFLAALDGVYGKVLSSEEIIARL
jgi:nicotinamidase-related amidase